jgi:hypothetical protein
MEEINEYLRACWITRKTLLYGVGLVDLLTYELGLLILVVR